MYDAALVGRFQAMGKLDAVFNGFTNGQGVTLQEGAKVSPSNNSETI